MSRNLIYNYREMGYNEREKDEKEIILRITAAVFSAASLAVLARRSRAFSAVGVSSRCGG